MPELIVRWFCSQISWARFRIWSFDGYSIVLASASHPGCAKRPRLAPRCVRGETARICGSVRQNFDIRALRATDDDLRPSTQADLGVPRLSIIALSGALLPYEVANRKRRFGRLLKPMTARAGRAMPVSLATKVSGLTGPRSWRSSVPSPIQCQCTQGKTLCRSGDRGVCRHRSFCPPRRNRYRRRGAGRQAYSYRNRPRLGTSSADFC
jgi:hypothetical protein